MTLTSDLLASKAIDKNNHLWRLKVLTETKLKLVHAYVISRQIAWPTDQLCDIIFFFIHLIVEAIYFFFNGFFYQNCSDKNRFSLIVDQGCERPFIRASLFQDFFTFKWLSDSQSNRCRIIEYILHLLKGDNTCKNAWNVQARFNVPFHSRSWYFEDDLFD